MKYHNIVFHDFICPNCRGKFPLPRKSSRKRKNGHIKDLYCPFCKSVKKFTEKY